jgi:glycosyltransferase involved in cell wall biosynthesis
MLHSICGQSYTNWKIILIDDVSPGYESTDESHVVLRFDDFFEKDQVTCIYNKEKKWEVANVLRGVSLCEDDDIVCRIDADDYLTDLDALAIMNHVYESTGCDVAWSMHRWGLSDRNISGPLPQGCDVYRVPWCSSHLKTFRKRLLNGVPYENFLNMNNELVRRAGDQCVYLPALHNSKKSVFVPRVLYHYAIDEQGGAVYQTDDAKFQKAEADFIRSRGYVSRGEPWEAHVKS